MVLEEVAQGAVILLTGVVGMCFKLVVELLIEGCLGIALYIARAKLG